MLRECGEDVSSRARGGLREARREGTSFTCLRRLDDFLGSLSFDMLDDFQPPQGTGACLEDKLQSRLSRQPPWGAWSCVSVLALVGAKSCTDSRRCKMFDLSTNMSPTALRFSVLYGQPDFLSKKVLFNARVQMRPTPTRPPTHPPLSLPTPPHTVSHLH